MFKKGKYLLVLVILLVVFTSIIITNAQEVSIANSFRFPLEGDWSPLWQDFGKWNNQWNGYHLGEDVGREDADIKNYAVYPMVNGIVKFADIVMGYTVIIEHKLSNDDPDGDHVCSVYYHMKRPEEGGIKLTVGESVSMDSPIGYISGKQEDYKSSPHLHFGIRKGPYKSGKDPSTGFWYYPGYTTIKKDGVVQKNPDDPIHKQILADWFNPTADKPGFIESHVIQIEQSTINSSSKNIERDSTSINQKGGYLIILECMNTPTNEKVNKTIEIVKSCLNELGILESIVRRCGATRILIELPKMSADTAMKRKKIIDFIKKSVQVEILRVETLGPVIEGDSITHVPIKEEEIKIEKEKLLIDSSLYHFEHSVPRPWGKRARLPVSVSGPADELALILTNPKGETDIKFISKRALIDNFETIYLMMGRESLSEGYYTLTVKTVTPEKVIYKKETLFTFPKDVQITGGEITIKRGTSDTYTILKEFSIYFKSDGDLPFFFDEIEIIFTLPGRQIFGKLEEEYKILPSLYSVPSGEIKYIGSSYRWFCYHGSSDKIKATVRVYKKGKVFLTFPMKLTIEK